MRLLSHVWSIARGSVAGITYSANQWHQIIARARTSPVQPNTNLQSTMRAAFSYAQVQWLALSDAQRLAWGAYALTCVYSGPMGNYTIPGRQMFTSCISLANYINTRGLLAMILGFNSPIIPGFLNLSNVKEGLAIVPQTGICVDVENNTGETLAIFAQRSVAFNSSRMRYKGQWANDSEQAISLATATAGKINFSGLTVGKIYFVRIRGVSKQSPHRISAEYIVRCTAVTTV